MGMILNQFCINFAKMKVLAILAIFTLTILKVESHGLTCMTCGKETVEGKVTYTGVCKDENDAGESVECDATETSYSCMSAMIEMPDRHGGMHYFKKCYETPFHANGCLVVDEEDGSTGGICFCDTPDCNTNYGNSGSFVKSSPIILAITSLLYLLKL